MKGLRNKIAGALYGVAIGDALGAPLEFMSQEQIAKKHGRVTEMIGGGWLDVEPGEITDDTQMTLAVAEGIIANPEDPIQEIGARFIEWAMSGPKDIGTTCSMSIREAAARSHQEAPDKTTWFNASKHTSEINRGRSGGNGALMRTVYPGLYYPSYQKAQEISSAVARMTHWDASSTSACFLYTHMIYLITEAKTFNIYELTEDTPYHAILKDSSEIERLEPTGYVVDSMKCALAAFWHTDRFDDAVIFAANLGGDADTIAAIAGGLAGVFHGYKGIPERWIQTLNPETRAQLDRLVDAAVKNREG